MCRPKEYVRNKSRLEMPLNRTGTQAPRFSEDDIGSDVDRYQH